MKRKKNRKNSNLKNKQQTPIPKCQKTVLYNVGRN
jgi:hypothetical protein